MVNAGESRRLPAARTAAIREGLHRIESDLARIEAKEREASGELRKSVRLLGKKIEAARRTGRWLNGYFNLFDTLGRPRLEDAHSNVLRWLLDPQESHGLGDRFLGLVLKLVAGRRSLSTIGASADRELRIANGRNDIVVRGPHWWLVVENKIDDTQDKTEEYARYWAQRGVARKYLVFLTPNRRAPKSQRFK